MHGTRTDRYLFLFEKILLITKRKETGYSCKATLMVCDILSLDIIDTWNKLASYLPYK